jgi:ribulose 1,5-bisphosphate carboxylase large subunit-like protein
MRQSWDAAVSGTPIALHAAHHPELAQALATW